MNIKDKIKMFNKAPKIQFNQESDITKNRSATIAIHPQKDKNIKPSNKPTKNDDIKEDKSKKEIEENKDKNKGTKNDYKMLLKRASAIIDKNSVDVPDSKLSNSIRLTESWIDLKVDPFSVDGLVELENIENFNESKFENRKYTKFNIENGKQFFKIRFIKNKIEKNNKSKSNNPFNFFSKKNEIESSNLDKEKDFIKYSSEFLLILEKAILSFNSKNYKESFDILRSSEIIKTLKEFGEFLLVVSGFDKNIIGEFLAKEKPPNEKGEVLNSFIDSINMKHCENTLLDCLRFLLSRINLPKDANLILVIMETFTNSFFNVNKNNKDFIDIFINNSNIYLLVSTLLALNTMFTRTDIKNMNIIKKDEFINMNKDINPNYLKELYDQLKSKPITMSEDYNENIYQKITTLVNEKNNKSYSNNNDISKNNNEGKLKNQNSQNNSNNQKQILTLNSKISTVKVNFDSFTNEDEKLLSSINKFYKISGAKTPNLYGVIVYENCSKLAWDKNLDMNKIKKNININDINEVYNGFDIAEHSSHIRKYFKAFPNEEKFCNSFISISYNNNKETLDLKCDNVELTLLWFKALKSLINKKKNEEIERKESQTDEEKKERENAIIDIWEKFILPKWEKYGNYLILKVHERSNFYYYLSNDLKQSTKNELIEDKKANSIKYINSFLDKIILNKKDLEINEFCYFCNLGFPGYLRKKVWKILIGNPCCITENLYNTIENRISKRDLNINFENLEKKYIQKKDASLNSDANINQMITDIINTKVIFNDEILELKKDQYKLMLSVYKIARVFFLFRGDIPYNKLFINFIYLFLLIEAQDENDSINAFINISNFLLNNNFIKSLIGNEVLRKDANNNNILFFNQLIKKYFPNIEAHFRKMEIIPELYFIPWMDELYINTLNTKILFQIFDLYLINGEYVLFQTSLTILKLLEDELMNMTISQILKLLKRLPDKYKKEKFLEVFNSFNAIKSEYVENKRKNELENQRAMIMANKINLS